LIKKSKIDWYQFLREVCIGKIIINTNNNNNEKIDGRVKVVEIDETVVVNRKNKVERVIPTVWLVGGVVRQEELAMFLEFV
jgi:hypothetical protein